MQNIEIKAGGKSCTSSFGFVENGFWSYGVEAWCNVEANMLDLIWTKNTLTVPVDLSVCSLGIFGTIYQ